MTQSDPPAKAEPGALRPILSALLALAVLYTLYFAASIIIPLVVAFLIALPLFPIVNFLNRLYVPRVVAGMALLVCIGVPFTLLGMELAQPAQRWVERIPELTEKVDEQLDSITEALVPDGTAEQQPVAQAQPEEEKSAFERIFGWFGGDEEPKEAPPPTPSSEAEESKNEISQQITFRGLKVLMDIIAGTPVFLAQFLAVILFVLFLLVYGPGVYRTAIEVFPQVRDKENARSLGTDTQRELSRYIMTVSTVNAGLGLVTTVALWLMNFEDPLLWGAMVALLNFAPYVGPILGATAIAIAGVEQYGFAWVALIPAGVYFAVNAVEANVVTPLVLGRTMRMNQLVTILWLFFWGWLWGAAGVLIAVPLLVCIKLILARFGLLTPWLQLIESR